MQLIRSVILGAVNVKVSRPVSVQTAMHLAEDRVLSFNEIEAQSSEDTMIGRGHYRRVLPPFVFFLRRMADWQAGGGGLPVAIHDAAPRAPPPIGHSPSGNSAAQPQLLCGHRVSPESDAGPAVGPR